MTTATSSRPMPAESAPRSPRSAPRDTSRASSPLTSTVKPTATAEAGAPRPPLSRRSTGAAKPAAEAPPSPRPMLRRTSTGPAATSPAPEPAAAPTEDETEAASPEIIDMELFNQILEMDDDEDDREFSKSIVWNYFEQAEATFIDMNTALEAKDLKQLKELGHFLKGSSAALGVRKVQWSCEKVQRYGQLRTTDSKGTITETEALDKITALMDVLKVQYHEAETWLKDYFGDV